MALLVITSYFSALISELNNWLLFSVVSLFYLETYQHITNEIELDDWKTSVRINTAYLYF